MLFLQTSETLSENTVNDIAYSLGFFVGSNLFEILIGGILIATLIIFLLVRTSTKKPLLDN